MFIHFNTKLVDTDTIECVTYDDLKENGLIHIHYKGGDLECVEGTEAVRLLMELDPGALEGENLQYIRGSWAIHNLIGHPLMQILSWLGYTRLGLLIHDITAPFPITKDR